jgi:hypothetical protein
MFRDHLKRVYQTLSRGRRTPRSAKLRRTSQPLVARLAVEGLEERALLSTLTLSGGALVYAPSTSLANTLSISHDPIMPRYTFVDTAENITLLGSFISPSGGGTHTVSFGDSNITSIAINTSNQNFTVNIEQTLASAPLTVNLGSGTDTVNVSPGAHNLINIQGAVTIHYGTGTDRVNVNDQAYSATQTYIMTASSVSRPGAALITYGPGINFVNINAGSGNNTYNIIDTEPVYTTTLNTGNGNDDVHVDSTTGPLVINLGNSNYDTVSVSAAAHNLNTIQGAVTVHAGQGFGQLNVHDQANSANNQTYSMTASSVSRTGSALITYVPDIYVFVFGGSGNNIYNVNGTATAFPTYLQTGGGNDTVNVESTNDPLTVDLGNGADSVNVSPAAHNLINIQGAITIHYGAGTDTVNVNDQASSASQTYIITANSVHRSGSVNIQYGPGINFVNIYGGSGNNTYNISGTEAFYPTTLNTGGGNDVVNVVATNGPLIVNLGNGTDTVNVSPVAQNLNNIQGAVTIHYGLGIDTLNVDDQANSANQTTYSMTASTVSRTGSGVITYGPNINFVNIYGGSGNNTYNVTNTETFFPTTLNTGGGNDVVNVEETTGPLTVNLGNGANNVNVSPGAQNLDNIHGAVSVNGQGSGSSVTVNDQGNGAGQVYTLISTALARSGAGTIMYGGIQALTVNGSSGGDTVQVINTALSTPVALNGGAGGMALYASDADNTWTVTAQNTGTLTSSVIAGTVTFTGAQSLHGGAGADYFRFANGAGVDGTIDGGGGVNTLDYSSYSTSVTVNLQVSAASGVGGGVANIQNVTGGNGGGTAGMYNLLIGNGGNVLTGGFGRRNLLVAGGSASTLNGGDQDDLLIAGTTAYDSDPAMAAWSQIAAVWNSATLDFWTRVNLLSTPGSGLPLLDASTVFGNGGGNTLNGTGELAWIFSDGMDTITGFDSSSVTTPINP